MALASCFAGTLWIKFDPFCLYWSCPPLNLSLIYFLRYDNEGERVKWFIYLTNWGFLIFCVALLVRAGTATYSYFNKGELDYVTVTY